jgi:hypothetical protein
MRAASKIKVVRTNPASKTSTARAKGGQDQGGYGQDQGGQGGYGGGQDQSVGQEAAMLIAVSRNSGPICVVDSGFAVDPGDSNTRNQPRSPNPPR